MNDQTQSPAGEPDDPIVGRDFIAAAVQAAAQKEPSQEQDLIAGEPLLSAYLRDGVLAALGKLALAGAGPQIVENVAEDMFRLIDIAANATRDAYRSLLNDFLAFGLASAPLVRISREILLIDPHFDPSEKRWRASLSELLAPLAGRCAAASRVEVHVTDMRESGRTKWALDWYLAECQRRLPTRVPAGLRVAVIVWRQRVGGEKLHPRYVLTERGGMRFEVGLDEGAPGQTTDVSLLDEELYHRRWQQYQRGTAAFQFVNQVEIVGSRRI